MDPFTIAQVLSTLATLATATVNRFDDLQKLLETEQEFAIKYKRSVATLQTEIGNAKALFNTIVVHGETTAVSSLLNSDDGKDASERLSRTLNSVETLLKTQMKAADRLIAKLRNREIRITQVIRSLLLESISIETDDINNVVKNAFQDLDERRQEVQSTFAHFKSMYELHNSRRPRRQDSVPLPPLPKRLSTGDINGLFETLKLNFYSNAFHVGISKSEEAELANKVDCLDDCADWEDRLTTLMEGEGHRWIEDQFVLEERTVQSCRKLQSILLRNLLKTVSPDSGSALFTSTDRSASNTSRVQLKEVELFIQKSLKQAAGQKFSIAFCGMVKAGKSLFLNAMIGRMVLPSNDLPSTAWPVRVRHVKGQTSPRLEVTIKPFQNAILQLQMHGYGKKMANYSPPTDDPFAAIMDDDESVHSVDGVSGIMDEAAARQREIYIKWVDLHPATKENLKMFETRGYRLPSEAEGEDQVERLLSELNDIVRLCHRLGIPFDSDNVVWPLLTVEFEALKNENISGIYEFVDLPGIGENFADYSFEELVRKVSKEVDVFVPIVSFKEVPKEDWRRLPELIKNGINRPPDLVVCTHLDQYESLVTELISKVVNVFWPHAPGSNNRVLTCSSKMGLSARALSRLSERGTPNFEDFWSRSRLEYDCAEKILGVGSPKPNYQRFRRQPDDWKRVINEQLKHSGLQRTISRLTTDMVVKAQQRILIYEANHMRMLLRKAITEQKRMVLEIRRSTRDYEVAYQQFRIVRASLRTALENWKVEETRMQVESDSKLQKFFKVLERTGLDLATKAVDATMKDTTQSRHLLSDASEPNTLVFTRLADAEMFLFASQKCLSSSLAKLKRQFANNVRKLANDSRQKQFDALKQLIKSTIEADIQPELKDEIIEELDERGLSVETLVFSTIRQQVVRTIEQRHTASSAFHAIENTIARPLLRSQRETQMLLGDLEAEQAVEDEERNKAVEQLGFMLRAPIAVIAAIPFVLGAGVWPFMTKSKKYLLKTSGIANELKTRVVVPFLDALKKEGETTLQGMTQRSSAMAREAVEGALLKEETRYANERNQKDQPMSQELLAASLAALANFLAADAALKQSLAFLKETI